MYFAGTGRMHGVEARILGQLDHLAVDDVHVALGATRGDILNYFLTENLLIGIGGVLVGALLAIGINLWMVTQFEMARLSLAYVVIGVVALLLLGQGAVLAPALRASHVSPVEATRSV